MKKILFACLTLFLLSSFVPLPAPLHSRLIGLWEVREITTKTWDTQGRLEKQEISYPTSSILWTFTKNQLKYPDGTSTLYTIDDKTKKAFLGTSRQVVTLVQSPKNELYIDWKMTTKTQEGKKVEQTYGLLKLQ